MIVMMYILRSSRERREMTTMVCIFWDLGWEYPGTRRVFRTDSSLLIQKTDSFSFHKSFHSCCHVRVCYVVSCVFDTLVTRHYYLTYVSRTGSE